MCTALLGPLDGNATDIMQKIGLAVIGRSPVERQIAFKQERGWRGLTFYQAHGDEFPNDYGGLSPEGEEWPALNVFTRDADGTIRHFWGGEMPADPDQDPRGAPDLTPLWNVLDLTPAGRGTDWYPKLDYPNAGQAHAATA